MDLEDLFIEIDWNRMDLLSNRNPTLLNSPLAYSPQQPSVQDSLVTVAPLTQAENIAEETNSSIMETLSQLVGDDDSEGDQLPKQSQNSFDELLDETQCYIPSMEEVIPEREDSSPVQSQEEMTAMDYYNYYSQLLENNNVAMMHDMGQQNGHNSNNQMLIPDNLANQNLNGMSNQQQPSPYSCIVQQNPVNAGVGNMNTGEDLMTDQTISFTALINQAINPSNGWNSPGEQTQGNGYNPLRDMAGFQQPSSTLNGSATLNSAGFAVSAEMNSAFLGLNPGFGPNRGSISQMLNMEAPQMETLLWPNAPVVQPQQVPPLSNPVNTITPPAAAAADNGLPISPSLGAQPLVAIPNMLNQNGMPRATSYGGRPYATRQKNPSVRPTYERREPPRRGRPRKHFQPGLVATPIRRRKRASGSSAKEKASNIPASQANNGAGPSRRKIPAPLYDIEYESIGLPRDPLLRLHKLELERDAALAAEKAAELAAAAAAAPISAELAPAPAAPISAELEPAPVAPISAELAAPISVENAATAAAPESVELAATPAAPESAELAATAAPNSAEDATTM